MTALMRIEYTCCGGLGYEKDSCVAGKTLRQSRKYARPTPHICRLSKERYIGTQKGSCTQLDALLGRVEAVFRFKDQGKSHIATGREVAGHRRGTRQLCFEGATFHAGHILVPCALEVAARAVRLQIIYLVCSVCVPK